MQSRQRLVLLGAEPRAAGDEHTAFDAGVEDFLFDFLQAARAGRRVLAVVDSEPDLGWLVSVESNIIHRGNLQTCLQRAQSSSQYR